MLHFFKREQLIIFNIAEIVREILVEDNHAILLKHYGFYEALSPVIDCIF